MYLIVFLGTYVSNMWGLPTFTTEGFVCKILKDGTISVSSDTITYTANSANVKTFHIPSTIKYEKKTYQVKRIDGQGFAGRNDITDIVIDNGVETIGNEAFVCCTNLKSVYIPAIHTRNGNRTVR